MTPVLKTRSAFHRRAQRRAFHRRDVYLQPRLFAHRYASAETQGKTPTGFDCRVANDAAPIPSVIASLNGPDS